MLNCFIFVNIDDILIFSRSLENHVQHVRAVLLHLLEHLLFVKAEKPLPVPGRPWSHISLDFVTGLLCCEGNSVILTIIDRFSKMAHFVPLQKLPSAKEMAQLLIHHMFRLHGLPIDVVSDQGPQFSSIFWKEFCGTFRPPPACLLLPAQLSDGNVALPVCGWVPATSVSGT